MQVKLIKGNEERLYECANIGVTRITEAMAAAQKPINRQPGIYIEMAEVNRVKGATKMIVLPDDADVVFVMNDLGKTTDTYRWPITAVAGARP
jgi:hypothetical protein